MKNQRKSVLSVSVLGMDERSCRLITMFFKGPCEGFAHVVDETVASVDIIDTHFAHSEQLIENSLSRTPQRCIIVLSTKKTERLSKDNLLYLDKPIKAEQMMEALDWANDICQGRVRQKPFFDNAPVLSFTNRTGQAAAPQRPIALPDKINPTAITPPPSASPAVVNIKTIEREQKLINIEEQRKKAKYRSAISVEENAFDNFVGTVSEPNLNDSNQRYRASYNAKHHYQGYLQFAYQSSLLKQQVLQLNCTLWMPLVILPHSKEIWLDADTAVVKEMAGVWLDGRNLNITPIPKDTIQKITDLEKIQDMNAFLWKLAIWTSKGRYPKALDVDAPIVLIRWPDFTRYIVTPHALRIAGLLIGRGPETMVETAVLLDIELRYVYVFISAAHALGLAIQAKRQADTILKTTLPVTPPVKKGLLNRIISKLRGQ
jgi:hypothetical protein